MKKKLIKFGVILIILLLASQGVASYLNLKKDNARMFTELIGQEEKFQSISKVVGQLGVKYATEATLKKEVTKQFGDTTNVLMGRIKVMSSATWAIKSKARQLNSADLTFRDGKFPYVMIEIRLDSGLPLGYVIVYESGKVVSKAYNYELNTRTAISRDEESGKYTILTKLDHTLKSPSLNTNAEKIWFNIPYELEISGGSAFIDPTEPKYQDKPKFHWFVPRLNISANLSNGQPSYGLHVSLAGWGKSKQDLTFKFLAPGFEYDPRTQDVLPSLKLVDWSPWRDLFPNTYLSFGIKNGTSGGVGMIFGLSVGF